MNLNSIYTPKQIEILKACRNTDWFMLINHGAKRSGKTQLDNDVFLQELIRVWRCRVNEHYGMTETALGGAVGCPVPGGYHIWASDLYYEIVDPDTGLPLPEGEEGETVVTTLMREAMPLIRYRTGDISRFVPGPCPCGSVLPRLERVRSRPQPKKFVPRAVPDAL